MNIVYCFNDKYTIPTGVSLLSVCENNKEEDTIEFHIVSEGLSKQSEKQLKAIAEDYGRNIYFHILDVKRLSNCPLDGHGQCLKFNDLSTYYRLLLSSTLPNTMDKVLYLDSDTIICAPLKELWDIDIQHYAVAAVPDCFGDRILHYNRLDYDFSLGYFSAGVLLINLAYWRSHEIEKKLLDYAIANADTILYFDQDVLNYVLRKQKKEISMKYNVMEAFLLQTQYVEIKRSHWEDMFYAAKFPVIIHYVGISKPWHKDSIFLLNKVWLRYYELSPWKGIPLKNGGTLLQRFKSKLRKRLVWVKIIKSESRYRPDLIQWNYERNI